MSNIRRAAGSDLDALSALCLRAKAVWGYDQAFLDACRNELTLRSDALDTTSIALIERGAWPLAMAQIEAADGVCDLLKLFVDPDEMGKGHGARLFHWAVCEGRRLGALRMTIESDPYAEAFYRRMGAEVIGSAPSAAIPGRRLPLLALVFADEDGPVKSEGSCE